jgi:4-hydroxy-tetrahydrodipicolinate reductase
MPTGADGITAPAGAPLAIAVAGALGRMGRAVAGAAGARADMRLQARFDRPDAVGPDLVPRDTALGEARVVVDFTSAAASLELARLCAERGGPALVIGSTGWTPAQDEALREATGRVAVVRAGNFSLGVNLLMGLVRQAARALPARDYDVEVLEAHHRRKVDAPSGTALMLGEAAAEGRGVELAAVSEPARAGITGPRSEGGIGFAVLRGGGVVGEHSVLFAAEDELITLSHSARDRALFARGALEAALWVADRPPGLYDMQDVLGLR